MSFLHLDKRIRYVLIGGWNTAVGLIVFAALYYAFNTWLHYLIILVISQVICITNAYLTNKFFVFATRGNYFREYFRFGSYYMLSSAANLALLPALVEIAHMKPVIAQAAIIVATIIAGFYWHNQVTFATRCLPCAAGQKNDR